MYYTTQKDDYDNQLEDLPELYQGELEQDGATDVTYNKEELESGIECHVFTGSYHATGIQFKHMVYFTDSAAFIYSYEAPKDDYEENIDEITVYLDSLTIHHENPS